MQNESGGKISAGLYWGKTSLKYEWWDLIVYIYGSEPFLKVKAWRYTEIERSDLLREAHVMVLGMRIDVPYEGGK